MDVDKDLPNIKGVSEGLNQYYEIEKTTDHFSLNSGRVFAKIGFNEETDLPEKIPATFVVIDNKPHLNEGGIKYISKKGEKLILVTANKEHPTYKVKRGFGLVLKKYLTISTRYASMSFTTRYEQASKNTTIT